MTDGGLSPEARAWLTGAGQRLNEPVREERSEDVHARLAGGRTGRTFAEVYGTGQPIPADEIAEWLADAEDYIPKLRAAGHEPMARFLVAAYFIIRQLDD